jgi:hypothetical protein
VRIERPDQIWSADITYVPMASGFMYLAATIDSYSRTWWPGGCRTRSMARSAWRCSTKSLGYRTPAAVYGTSGPRGLDERAAKGRRILV